MDQTISIAKRELTSFFYSPVGYLVVGLFALITTMLFLGTFREGQPATLRPVFEWVVWLMVFLVPALSMRLFADEFRSGTIETLMTSPVTDTQVVLGKWLGAVGFFVVLLLPMVVMAAVLACMARPDYGPILTGLLGLLLVGGLYLAIGAFASAVTQNQIIAFILGVLVTGLFTIGLYMISNSTWVGMTGRQVAFYLNVDRQFTDFSKGLIDASKLIYFVSGIALFLFLSVKTLESRRWR